MENDVWCFAFATRKTDDTRLGSGLDTVRPGSSPWRKLLQLALMQAAARAAAPALADPHALTRQGKDAACPLAAVLLRTIKSNHCSQAKRSTPLRSIPGSLSVRQHTNASASNKQTRTRLYDVRELP